MAEYISSQESQKSDDNLKKHPSDFDKMRRKRIAHFLVDKPLEHPFPIETEHESLLSIGEG